MNDFYIKEGDTLPVLTGTIRDANGAAQDLTNATAVVFKMRKKNATALLVQTGVASILSPASDGRVSYAWGADAARVAGDYEAEFEAVFANGTKLTAPTRGYIDVHVVADLDP